MKSTNSNSRRNFLGLLATGAVSSGLALIPNGLQAAFTSDAALDFMLDNANNTSGEMDAELKRIGKLKHPICYDQSQANPWGVIWSNVYYMTNEETGTPGNELGVINVLRHHGMLFAMNDETIKKYKLGEFFHFNDPTTDKPTLRNPFYEPVEGTFPVPGLAGIKKLQEMGTHFCVCDMARKVNAMFIAQKMGLKQEDVYKDLVEGTLPGITPAPSGVWVLGRLAENKIAYVDASVG